MIGSLRRTWEARNAGTSEIRTTQSPSAQRHRTDVESVEKHCFEKKGAKVKGQSFPREKGNKTLRREAMVKKAKAHVAEAEEDHDEEDEAYFVEGEEDEDIDGDLFDDGYVILTIYLILTMVT
jgi:hypothetical protein